MINEQYQSVQSVCQLADAVFQGTPVADPELQQRAMKITKNISNNYRPQFEAIENTSDLENYPTGVEYLPKPELDKVPQTNCTK